MDIVRSSKLFQCSLKCRCTQPSPSRRCRRSRRVYTGAIKTENGPSIVIVDSLGQLGERFLKAIKNINLPYSEIALLASDKDAGVMQDVGGKQLTVQELQESSFEGVDLALFMAEETDSIGKYGPIALLAGAVVVKCLLDSQDKLIVQEGFFEVMVEEEQQFEDGQQQLQGSKVDGKGGASSTA